MHKATQKNKTKQKNKRKNTKKATQENLILCWWNEQKLMKMYK